MPASRPVSTSSNSAQATRARLAAFLPPEAAIGNPVDMVASAGADEYRRTIEVAMTADDIDALIVIFTPVDRRKAARDHRGDPRGHRGGTPRRRAGKNGSRVRHGRTRRAHAARLDRRRNACRSTRFRKTPRGRSGKSPHMPPGGRSRRRSSGASTTSAPPTRATCAARCSTAAATTG